VGFSFASIAPMIHLGTGPKTSWNQRSAMHDFIIILAFIGIIIAPAIVLAKPSAAFPNEQE
jgi:hypothetical protein